MQFARGKIGVSEILTKQLFVNPLFQRIRDFLGQRALADQFLEHLHFRLSQGLACQVGIYGQEFSSVLLEKLDSNGIGLAFEFEVGLPDFGDYPAFGKESDTLEIFEVTEHPGRNDVPGADLEVIPNVRRTGIVGKQKSDCIGKTLYPDFSGRLTFGAQLRQPLGYPVRLVFDLSHELLEGPF